MQKKMPKILRLALLATLLLTGCMKQYSSHSSYPVHELRYLNPQYVTISDGKLEYYQFGQGSPIVLIAGYASDITSWDKRFLAQLANAHEVIVFNNRNVGGSTVKATHYTNLDLATDTHELIHGLHLYHPTVIGYSMGGMVAQTLAANYPDDISDLILINTAILGKKSVQPMPQVRQALWNFPKDRFHRYQLALTLCIPPKQQAAMKWTLAFDRFLPQTYTEIDIAKVVPQQHNVLRHWMTDNITANKLARLAMPVLILNGKEDIILPPDNSTILASTIPGATLHYWNDGGHAMLYQHPIAIATVINDFIARKHFHEDSHLSS